MGEGGLLDGEGLFEKGALIELIEDLRYWKLEVKGPRPPFCWFFVEWICLLSQASTSFHFRLAYNIHFSVK